MGGWRGEVAVEEVEGRVGGGACAAKVGKGRAVLG